jgi:hypothetical protein
VRKAKLRSNYQNRDINLKQQLISIEQRNKFHPYFQEITRQVGGSSIEPDMKGTRSA